MPTYFFQVKMGEGQEYFFFKNFFRSVLDRPKTNIIRLSPYKIPPHLTPYPGRWGVISYSLYSLPGIFICQIQAFLILLVQCSFLPSLISHSYFLNELYIIFYFCSHQRFSVSFYKTFRACLSPQLSKHIVIYIHRAENPV